MWQRILLNNWKIFLLILTIILVILYALASGHLCDGLIYYNQSLATLSYIAIILSAIFVAYQAYLFRKDYETRKEHSEFDTAYRLAGYYAHENILNITDNLIFVLGIFITINPTKRNHNSQLRA